MAGFFFPVLWVGGAVILLGGGFYILQVMH
jgi:hypothetical protein